jgi:hypothetical protein
MAYVVALTRSKYQYKLSLPKRLVDGVGWQRERVLLLEQRDDGSLIIKPFSGGVHGTTTDRADKN